MPLAEPKVTLDLARGLGLTADEYRRILTQLGREPSYTELGLFSALWSEHCAYKHSRVFLKTLPTAGPRVLQGPGENAGALDIGDGWAVVFKMESHNHPSFIEPFQGAATGVGGILRDIFTMGARPIALLDSLRFGPLQHPRVRYLFAGAVKGIGDYGNCVGIPNIGGEVYFDESYEGNPLVNAMAIGLMRTEQLIRAEASGVGVTRGELRVGDLPDGQAIVNALRKHVPALFESVDPGQPKNTRDGKTELQIKLKVRERSADGDVAAADAAPDGEAPR